MIENQDERVWDVVEDVIKEHPVMLNRAPTLHRLGIQAFEPKLVSGKAIRLHPLVCAGFNADFDGDQMAVHVPLSEAAQAEARLLMLSSNNILDPKDGKPIVTPSQDMVLGNYYITTEKPGDKGEGRVFKNANEAIEAYERREVTLHARIALPAKSLKYNTFTDEQKEMYLVTTVGKLLFNEILPDGFQYINEPTKANYEGFTPMAHFLKRGSNIPEEIKKKEINKPFAKGDLKKIIAQVFKRYKTTETSIYLDKLKNLGFKYSTLSGISISIADVVKSEHKNEIIDKSQKVVDTINKQYRRGLITDRERYEKVCEVWNNTTSEVEKELKQKVQTLTDNPIMMMVNSGARGSIGQYNQMAGMRGLLAKPNGDAVEIPVTSSFVDGLSVSEYFISTHGTRKGNADTALKTADSGYLTRRLVDVVQDVIVREEDCGTIQGVVVKAFVDESDGTVIESLHERITGRYTNKKVVDPETKQLIIDKNELITEPIADKIDKAGIKEVEIRTALTCKTENGVCKHCYGINLATGNIAEIGEAVGIMAAQSIGEPGTQLTMRTFHNGGVASGADITQGLPRVQELFEARNPKAKSTIAEIDGKITKIDEVNGKYKIAITNDVETREHTTNYGVKLCVELGQSVKAGDKLNVGSVNPKELLAVTDPITAQNYILSEVQKVYKSQGVDVSDKHIEILARRMIARIKIVDGGETELVDGKLVSMHEFTRINKEAIINGKKPATGRPIMLGITKASLETDSFLSAASFQETTRILTDASIKGKVDNLTGLKENVIIGKLIPAGTGSKYYSNVKYSLESEQVEDDALDVLEDQLTD